MKELYDRDYFERGLETGKSCYQNYRWIPELTIPMAMTIIDYLGIRPEHKVLDFGCAKGFMVKAMRWLKRECYGYDISKYALDNCDPEVSNFCHGNIFGMTFFDFCIAKDVFEHVPLAVLEDILTRRIARTYFVIVPLGENGKYRAPANNMDVTHLNCMTEVQWEEFFLGISMRVLDFAYKVDGIKDSYYEKYLDSHGFFTLCH